MRRVGGAGIALVMAVFVAEPLARADEPPIVVEPTIPDLPPPTQKPPPSEPSPVKIEMPAGAPPVAPTAPAPPPAKAPAAAPAPVAKPEPARKRPSFTELGLGPTYFGVIRRSGVQSELGAVFSVAARAPIGDHYGIGFRFAYGMTGWDRIEDVARPGYKIGRWTSEAYSDVWNWAGEGDDNSRGLRIIGAFFAFIGLIVPYVVAGALYVVSPLAASSYGEVDLTFNWEPGDDPKNGPFFKAGAGGLAYIHPSSGRLFAGVGPNLAAGWRADNLSFGFTGTFLPYGLHGDDTPEHVFVTSLTLSLVH